MTADQSQILAEFTAADAILKGHFILSSGLHSDTYLQCARIFMDPVRAEKLCKLLAAKIHTELKNIKFDYVVAPAMGGVIIGYELARQLNLPNIFCERENGIFTFRRGFSFPPGSKILIVEDVITTGKSSLETIKCIEEFGGKAIAEACLVYRGDKNLNFPLPVVSLLEVEVKNYAADNLPDHLKNIPAYKPGSRWLSKA